MSKHKDVSKETHEDDYEGSDEEVHEGLDEDNHESHQKRHSRKSRRSRTIKEDSNNPWLYASIALAVLLVVSIFTHGFRFSDLNGAISQNGDGADTKTGLAGSKVDTMQDGSKTDAGSKTSSFSGKPVTFEMYVMSQCPHGTQVMDGIAPVKKKLGDALDLHIEYIFYPPTQYAGNEAQFCVNNLCSMHGTPEVKGNIVQLCAREYYPVKYYDMLTCMNSDMGAIPNNWESCAEKSGIETAKIKTCYEGEEGKTLASESAAKASAKGATGSPTMFMNGQPYTGGRGENDFLRAICNAFEGTKPLACADIPEPVSFELTVVTDSNCGSACDPSQIIAVSKNLFPGVKVKTVDVNSDEGKDLVKEYKLVFAPSYLFGEKVTETETWKDPSKASLQQAFEKTGPYYRLIDSQSGASYYIDKEKRVEQQAKFENYPKDNLEVLGYDGTKPRLDYFVMAFCPYGNPADEAASDLYNLFGDQVEIVPHYIIDVDGDKVLSMHGEGEGNQGVRELCAYEEIGAEDFYKFVKEINKYGFEMNASKLPEYIQSSLTINNGIPSNYPYNTVDEWWGYVADQVGVDKEVIKACEAEKKLEIAAEQSQMNSDLRNLYQGQLVPIGASPTFLINGDTYSGARDANSLKTVLCEQFEDAPAECSENIAVAQQAAPATGSC
jgi:hypothetical protein